jgi:hypothetical protein
MLNNTGKNKIVRKILSTVGSGASALGNGLLNFSDPIDTSENPRNSIYEPPEEMISAPSGRERTPGKIELATKGAINSAIQPIKSGARDLGVKLNKFGESTTPRSMQMKDFYENNLPLSPEGKKMFSNTQVAFPSSVAGFQRVNPSGSWGETDFKNNNIEINPDALQQKGAYRAVLMHELSHQQDKNSNFSTNPEYMSMVESEGIKNPVFDNFIKSRISDYQKNGQTDDKGYVDPKEIYAFVNEYILSDKNKTNPVNQQIKKYYPQLLNK